MTCQKNTIFLVYQKKLLIFIFTGDFSLQIIILTIFTIV